MRRASCNDLTRAISKALAEAGVEGGKDVAATGIGVAGLVAADRVVDHRCAEHSVVEELQARGNARWPAAAGARLHQRLPGRDAGRATAGVARHARNAIGVFVGTGVGAALIIDGVPYLGSGGIAGNIGRFRVHSLSSLAGSKRHGYVDDTCSRSALASEAASLAARHYAPYLAAHVGTDVTDIRSGDLRDAIDNGDETIDGARAVANAIAGHRPREPRGLSQPRSGHPWRWRGRGDAFARARRGQGGRYVSTQRQRRAST